MEIPDQYMLSNDKSDEQHHAVVRSITMSRILRSISPSEPVRVMCRYLKIFNRWEPIALVEDKV